MRVNKPDKLYICILLPNLDFKSPKIQEVFSFFFIRQNSFLKNTFSFAIYHEYFWKFQSDQNTIFIVFSSPMKWRLESRAIQLQQTEIPMLSFKLSN